MSIAWYSMCTKAKIRIYPYVDGELCKNKRIKVVKEKKPGNKGRKTFTI